MLFTKQVKEKLQIMINQLDLLWVLNFTALGIYSIFGTKFSWSEEIDTFSMSNVCYLAVIFLGVTARYLVVAAGYCSLRGGYWWLLFITARYWSFPLLVCTDFCIFCYIHIYFVLIFMSRPIRMPVNGNLIS